MSTLVIVIFYTILYFVVHQILSRSFREMGCTLLFSTVAATILSLLTLAGMFFIIRALVGLF